MGVILQAAYRRSANPTVSVPGPIDGHGDPWWYDHLATHMHEYAASGFTHFQLPPVHMTIGGPAATSDGYGVWWEYHLGSNDRPTRFGTEQTLRRLCAIGYANGLTPLADWVPHQRYGGNNGVYLYPSAAGKDQGRFPKHPGCFRGDAAFGRVADDPVPDPFWDIAFGDELCPINSVPKGYVLEGLEKAGDWLFRTLDLGGCRSDDTKGQAFEAVNRWVRYGAMQGKIMIGEYADGSHDTLAWWLNQVPHYCYTYDFDVKYRMRDMCNNGSHWDMRQLTGTGLASLGPAYATRAVTFIENADSDTNGFGTVVFNKLLAYAYILTAEGWPSIYYRDYATDKYCYGLKPKLENLIWIQEHLASGATWFRHAEYQFAVYERQGGPGLLVGLNNDIWGGWKQITVPTSFGPNTRLHDYTGHANDVWTDGNGNATIWIPPNDNGAGYVCFSRDGRMEPNTLNSFATTQLFEGAPDLVTGPAGPSGTAMGEVWCAEGTPLELKVESGAGLLVEVTGPDGQAAIPKGELHGVIASPGWHKLTAFSPSPEPYKVLVTYTAPKTLAGI